MIQSSNFRLVLALIVLINLAAILLGRLSYFRTKTYLSGNLPQVVQYEAPKILSPAELGWLYERRIGSPEIDATIISLIQKGLLVFEESDGETLIKKTEVKGAYDIDNLEAYVRQAATANGSEPIAFLDLRDQVLTIIDPGQLKEIVIAQMIKKGLIDKNDIGYLAAFRNRTFQVLAIVSTLITVGILKLHTSHITSVYSGEFKQLADELFNVYLVMLCLLLVVIYAVFWKAITNLYYLCAGTPIRILAGHQQFWRDIIGYRLYLEKVESDNFALEQDDALSSPDFPYALALGISKVQ